MHTATREQSVKVKNIAHMARSSAEFQRAYGKLNKAQKNAVDMIEGPVMVIAGPGTGKTEVVAVRVAHILEKTQMRPSNILCLTFSSSGAKTMRERLRCIIGSDAYGVTVETVHSFCNDIILQHPHVFEDFRALEKVSEIERLRIVRECMKKLGPGSILRRPLRENDRAAEVLSRMSNMKREGISPEELREKVSSYRQEVQITSSGKERDPSSQAYKDDQRLVTQFQEFIQLYEEYGKALLESHRYDYDDMILVVSEALQKHEWLLSGIQERYQYFLIDEFQDLNGAQNQVIELFTKEPLPGQKSNIFVVGDDDQAIYRFQGANIGNMRQFLNRFPDAAIITLTESYRATQLLLDCASKVIEGNEERLVKVLDGITKDLRAAPSVMRKTPNQDEALVMRKDTAPKPQFIRYPTSDNEHAAIALLLKSAHEKGMAWNDMAVLCRRNEELEMLYEVFRTAEIPVVLTAKHDLLLHPEVRQAIVLLHAVERPDNDAILSAALGVGALGCHGADLGRMWCAWKNRRIKYPVGEIHDFQLQGPEKAYTTLRSFLFEKESLLPEPLRNAHHLIEGWHSGKGSLTLPALLERVLKESGLLPAKEESEADPRRIAGLHAFYDFVKGWVYERKSLTLVELLSNLYEYENERQLKLEYDLPHLTPNGVQLMTVHAAKGLEFTLVIIPHVYRRNWEGRTGGSSLKLPDHLIFGLDREMEKRSREEDERRLIYVAMTRAKRHLIMTFPESYRAGEEMRDAEVSSFIAEAGETLEHIAVPPGEVPAPLETLYRKTEPLDEAFRAFLSERLETFQLSVTALNAFLDDPQAFLWTHLLNQPQAKKPHLAYGSVVHKAIELRNLAWQTGELFSTEDLIGTFEKLLFEREVFTNAEREHYLHVGRAVLKLYGRETENDRPIILSTERSLQAVLGGREAGPPGHTAVRTGIAKPHTANREGIPLTGKVDRIDLFQPNGQNCRIVDYKTGEPKKTEGAVRKEGNLFRQLVFYKLLCDLSPSFTHTAAVFTLDFIGNEKHGRTLIECEISDTETLELQKLIKTVWAKIIALDFAPL